MDELKIFWTQTAKEQRDHIFDYWNKRNKNTDYSKKTESVNMRENYTLEKLA